MFFTRYGSLRLFQVAGIDVFVHWSWLLVALFQVQSRTNAGEYAYENPRLWNWLEYLTLFGIVLLHEFGHALACLQVGGFVDRIVLWPLGGIAFVNPPPQPARVLWSIVAGPLVNVLLIPVTVGLFLLGKDLGWQATNPDLYLYLNITWKLNLLLLILNLLPIYPLDGGRILHALLWFIFGRVNSLMAVSILGILFSGMVLLVALGKAIFWLSLVTAFVLFQAIMGFRQARMLSRLLAGPRHKEAACPSCGTAPLAGRFWTCDECDARFDTFEQRAQCPACGKYFETTRCPDCYKSHPIKLWFAQAHPAEDHLQGTTGIRQSGSEEVGER